MDSKNYTAQIIFSIKQTASLIISPPLDKHQKTQKQAMSVLPMSCAGHRGMNRTASTDSLNQPPPGCVPNWNQGHPVKGMVTAFH